MEWELCYLFLSSFAIYDIAANLQTLFWRIRIESPKYAAGIDNGFSKPSVCVQLIFLPNSVNTHEARDDERHIRA